MRDFRQRDAAISAAEGRGLILSCEQRDAFDYVTGEVGLALVVGYAGSGKSAMLGVAREAWEREGYTVRGAVPRSCPCESVGEARAGAGTETGA